MMKETCIRAIVVVLLCAAITGRSSGFEGISLENDLFRPGKADLLYRYKEDNSNANFIWWTPSLKAGCGIIDRGEIRTKYIGGYLRPLRMHDVKSELILGFLFVGDENDRGIEVQGEYRLPSGLGFGAGHVEQEEQRPDITFGKITYRNTFENFKYILETQIQRTRDRDTFGGYASLYDDRFMLTLGADGEQWRTALGYIAPDMEHMLRPSIEILFVDNTPGVMSGVEFLFINASLRHRKGFLSHFARLGRSLGPTGVEFGNPLGFLRPTWNRRLDVWEIGELANLRIVRVESPDATRSTAFETMIFPLQFFTEKGTLRGLFLGGSYNDNSTDDTGGIFGGYMGKPTFLQIAFTVGYDFDLDEFTLSIGIIDWL